MSWKDTNRVRKLRLKKDKSKSEEYIAKEERELKDIFISGLVKSGLTEKRGEELWSEIAAWGSYGFNAAHAKAYGMVTMQTAYLRFHYPLEFFAALLTVGQADELQTYVNGIQKQGFEILPVDVNKSGKSHLMEGNAIRLALGSVKTLGPSAVDKVVAHQPYLSFEQFLTESTASKTVCDALIRTGAFTDLCPDVSVATLLLRHEAYRSDKKLSHKKNRDVVAPTLQAIWGPKDDPIELMSMEQAFLGFNLRGTPFSINDRYSKVDRLVEEGICSPGWKEFAEDEGILEVCAPFLVKSIKERPQKNGKLFAYLKLTDRDGQEFEAPCFANIWEHVRTSVRMGDVYVMIVHRRENEPTSFVVGRPGWKQTPRSAASAFIAIDFLEI